MDKQHVELREHPGAHHLDHDFHKSSHEISNSNMVPAPPYISTKFSHLMAKIPKIYWEMLAEFIGTFVFILAGIGVVASAVFANAQV
jgi:hypothetical protein